MSTLKRIIIGFAAFNLLCMLVSVASAVSTYRAAIRFQEAASWPSAISGSPGIATSEGVWMSSVNHHFYHHESGSGVPDGGVDVDLTAGAAPQNIVTASTAPILAPAVGLGFPQTATLDAHASNSCGTITLTSSSSGVASAVVVELEFNNPTWATVPHCVITPSSAFARALSSTQQLFFDYSAFPPDTTHANISTGSSGLPIGTGVWNYVCAAGQ